MAGEKLTRTVKFDSAEDIHVLSVHALVTKNVSLKKYIELLLKKEVEKVKKIKSKA